MFGSTLQETPQNSIIFWLDNIKRTKKKIWNSDVGNCIKALFKMRFILIDSYAGQSEDCPRPRARWGLKQSASILLIWVFIFYWYTIPWQIFSFNVANEAYNFLNPRKIAIQHLNKVLPANRPKHGPYFFKVSMFNYSFSVYYCIVNIKVKMLVMWHRKNTPQIIKQKLCAFILHIGKINFHINQGIYPHDLFYINRWRLLSQ